MDQVLCLEDVLAAFDFKVVRSCLDRRDFDAAIGLLTRHGKSATDAPADLQPGIRDAQQRTAKLAELVAAVDSGNEKSMAAIFGSPLLHNYPGATTAIAAAKDAPRVMSAIQRLESARTGRRWRELVREWDASQTLLTRPNGSLRKSAAAFQGDVANWRTRNALCDQVLAAVRAPSRDLAALHAAWTKLIDQGGHPECDLQRRTIEGLLSTYRPVQPSKAQLAVPVPRPQPQPPQLLTLSRPAPQVTAQSASVPLPQAVTSANIQPLARPIGRNVQSGAAFATGRQASTTVATPPLRTAWTAFATEAVYSTVAVILRWVPAVRWLAQRIPAGAISPSVIMKAIALSLAATVGAFGGALFGEGLISLKPILGQRFTTWLDEEHAKTLTVSLGAVLALILAQTRSLRRPGLASWRQLLAAVAVVSVTALATAAIERFIPGDSIATSRNWSGLGLWMCRSFFQWGVLGAALGLGATRIIPNLRIMPALLGGLAAGAFAAIADMTTHSLVNETAGHVVGAGCLGILFGTIAAIMEAATRQFFLELDRGDGLPPSQVSLGLRPVTAGSDASLCDIVMSDASRPLAYKYSVDHEQIYLLDYATNQPARITFGDRRPLGSIVLVVAGNSRQPISTGSRPSPLLVTSQPSLGPQAVATPTKLPQSKPLSRPAPPGPPPPKAP